MKHSPEPWRASKSNGICGFGPSIFAANNSEVVSTRCEECRNGKGILGDEDARRIVACVNACKGIPTELLENHFLTIRESNQFSPGGIVGINPTNSD